MARSVGGPPSSRRPTQSVSPAVAALVIVVVLALVVALWLKFTSGPSKQTGQKKGGLFGGGKMQMPTTLTPAQIDAAKKVQQGLNQGMQQATGGRPAGQ